MFPLRDDNPHFLTPIVTYALIAANVLAWALLQGLGTEPALSRSVCELGLTPGELLQTAAAGARVPVSETAVCIVTDMPSWFTPLTSMFMHGGWLHLIGNMWFLWIFGNNVEDSMGPLRFIVFYLLAGLAADAAHIIPTIPLQSGEDVPTLGASGAVAGVLGGYLLLFPQARVVTVIFIIFFFTILEIPAILFLGIWILQQAVFAYFDLLQPTGQGGGVAYFAHIGGFAFGLLLIRVFASERRRLRQIERMR